MKQRLLFAACGAFLTVVVLAAPVAAQWEVRTVGVKVAGVMHTYDYDDLKKLAKDEGLSSRGTKKRDSVPLLRLLTADTGVSAEEIGHLLFVGTDRSMLLEGDDLQYLDRLSLKLGTLRPAILTDRDETWFALQPTFGKPRFKNLEKIYVYRTGELR